MFGLPDSTGRRSQRVSIGRRSRRASTGRRLRRIALVPFAGAVAVAVAASPALGATAAQTQGNQPFARGMLLSRSGSTLDLQGFNGDTKVIVTTSTKYAQTKAADSSAVTVGACVRVTGTGSASKGIAATTIAVSPAASNCTRAGGPLGAGDAGGRFRGRNGTGNGSGNNGPLTFGGGNGNGTNGGNTNGNPGGGSANGNRPGFPTNFGSVAGKVTKVSGDKVTVKGQVLQAPTKKNARPKATTKPVAVTLSSTTTVDQTLTATDAVLTVGTCVTAAGTADSVGTVTANTVTVSAPENGSCTGGFRFGRGGGPGGPGDPGATTSTSPTT
jgi:hypothetical protein